MKNTCRLGSTLSRESNKHRPCARQVSVDQGGSNREGSNKLQTKLTRGFVSLGEHPKSWKNAERAEPKEN